MHLAIVDGYSTGRVLAQRLQERGVSCVHLQSQPESHPYYRKSFQPESYVLDLGYSPDTPALAARLTALGVERVVPGTESGVLLADTLCALMKAPGNRADTAAASGDKDVMARLAAEAGIAVPRGAVFSAATDALAWYRDLGTATVVAKPLTSAGSDNVHFCSGEAELVRACEQVLCGSDVYGEANQGVLVQERVRGVEYFIDTVSHEGLHRVAELWRYHKRVDAHGVPLYDFQEPVTGGSAQWRTLRGFAFEVLDVLGIRSGSAHTEVMLTDRGPVLIETGARLGGGTLPEVVEKYSGVSQTSLLVETLLAPGYLARFDEESVRWSASVRFVDLCNHRAGTVSSNNWRERVGSLPTFVAMVSGIGPGTHLDRTSSLLDAPGYLYLASDDRAEIERDYATLRRWELDGLYTE